MKIFSNLIIAAGAVALSLFSVSATAPANGLTVPTSAVVRALVADISQGNVAQQWGVGPQAQGGLQGGKGDFGGMGGSSSISVTYAWDLANNCYSELWNGAGMSTSKSSCWGKVTTFDGKKCNTAADTTVYTTTLNNYYGGIFNITEGAVTDPFFPDTANKFNLWRNPSNTSWIWLNQTTNDVVYIQDQNAAMKKTLVYYLPTGLTGNTGVSNYNFQLFQCAKPF